MKRFVIAILVLATAGCYYDIEEELYPGGCQIGMVTYTETVVPILERECYTCHDALSQNGGINLEGYDNVLIQVENGRLLGAIRHEAGFSPMPDGRPKIDACSIGKIEKWVDEGALDN